MDYSLTFARHFSRLVWLLLNDRGNIDEQKAALRAIVTVSRDGPVALVIDEWRLVVNGAPMSEALRGVQDLAAQLIGHAVRELTADQAAAAGDLLGIARLLAAEPVPGDGGRAIEAQLAALGAKTVHIRVRGLESLDAPGARGAAAPAVSALGPGVQRDLGVMTDETSGTFLAFAAVQAPKGSAEDIIAQLDATRSVNATTRLLDELVNLADGAGRDNRSEVVASAFYAVIVRDEATSDGDLKRAYTMAIRRLMKPTLLRQIAMMLPRRKEKHDEYMAVLSRAGEDGADALIEQLTQAQSLSDRRIFFDALVSLKSGISALVHMLGDARWFVARNAADLLGEMQAAEAERPLAELTKHDDDRVRRAAITALAKIGTPKAAQAMQDALRDSSAQVRMQAAAAIATRGGGKSAGTLTRALDLEEDVEVQVAMLTALGRIATPDAVQRLIKAAEQEGRIFKKKPIAVRLAAVQALGEARTPAATAALQQLRDDRDKEIRDAVFKIVMQPSGRPATGSHPVVK